MKGLRLLETVTTKYLVITLTAIVVVVVSAFVFILVLKLTDIETLATFVDAVFKTIAMLVAATWALNRYYVGRTDAPQIRVDADVSLVSARRFPKVTGDRGLLIYRLDVINTGKTLIKPYQQSLEVHAVVPSDDTIEYLPVWRWPAEGMHSGGPIEPRSWSAISQTISVPPDVQVVRLYLELQLSDGASWTWHKVFDLSEDVRMSE